MSNNFFVILGALALMLIAFVGTKALNKHEIYECHQWENQAKNFPEFYITDWQDQQCRTHKIIINAPVK